MLYLSNLASLIKLKGWCSEIILSTVASWDVDALFYASCWHLSPFWLSFLVLILGINLFWCISGWTFISRAILFSIYCRCGYEFCYTCGAEWKNKKATCSCPLWEEQNILNDDYSDDESDYGDDEDYDYDYSDYGDDYNDYNEWIAMRQYRP